MANSKLRLEQRDSMIEEENRVEEGSSCRKCTDKCAGFHKHPWRKICSNCYCPQMEHRKSIAIDETAVIQEHDEYLWKPNNCTSDVVKVYFGSLPRDKVPIRGTEGETYRLQQLANQLPFFDNDIKSSINNERTEEERELFLTFLQERKRKYRGRGVVKMRGASDLPWQCQGCNSTIEAGEVAVFAEKAGANKCWHPACFTCPTCKELIVDLIYFYNENDGKIYCGRHHADQLKMRCAGCDELILCEEFVVTGANNNWHKDHLCCRYCDSEMAGKSFFTENDYPVCFSCSKIVPVCKTCGKTISVEEECIVHGSLIWHAIPECCFCISCKCDLVDKQYLARDNRLFCSKRHYHYFNKNEELKRAPAVMNSFFRRSMPKQGYLIAGYNCLCVAFIPESKADDIKIHINTIVDPADFPVAGAESIRITPVIKVTSNSSTLEKPVIIEVMKTVQLSDRLTSNNPNFVVSTRASNSKTKWKDLSGHCRVVNDRVHFKSTELGYFTVFAQFPHPSASVTLNSSVEAKVTSNLTIRELPGFKLQFPPNCTHSKGIIDVKATAYYSDPQPILKFSAKGGKTTIASPCVSLEPHGLRFSKRIPILLPIPDWDTVKNNYPDAKLQLWHKSGAIDSIHDWEIVDEKEIRILKTNGITLAETHVSHFSCKVWGWSQSIEDIGDISRSFLKRVLRVSTRCQVFITRDRALSDPNENISSFRIDFAVSPFGKKFPTPVSKVVYDSGDEPIVLPVGELNIILDLSLPSHRAKQQQKSIKLTNSADCTVEFVITLHGSLRDVQELGQLKIFHATNKCHTFNLKKSLDVEDILEYLRPVQFKWQSIGKELGIDNEILDTIRQRKFGQDLDRLEEVIEEWIKSLTSSWGILANALQSTAVGEDVIALKIRDMMREGFTQHTSSKLAIVSSPSQESDMSDAAAFARPDASENRSSDGFLSQESDMSDAAVPTRPAASKNQPSDSFLQAEKKAEILFLHHQLLECDCSGAQLYIKEHDIMLRIPKGAVADGKKIQFEVGVAMYGYFTYPAGMRPISPIVWLCNFNEDPISKPFQLILPHFLAGVAKEKCREHQIEFGKAIHNRTTDSEELFHFDQCKTKTYLASDEYRSYGVLKSTHCCFYCLLAKDSPSISRDASFSLARVERQPLSSPNKNEVLFIGMYLLETCIKALEEQYLDEEDYKCTITHIGEFKFKSANHEEQQITLRHEQADSKQYLIALQPNPAVLRAEDIDFWKSNHVKMRVKQRAKTYPPRVKMIVTMRNPDLVHAFNLKVGFSGSSNDDRLQMDITFPLGFPDRRSASSIGSETHLRPEDIHIIEDKPTLRDALRDIFPLRAQWKNIGIFLGLSNSDTNNIEATNNGKPEDCLREILNLWINKSECDCTWKNLLDAISTVEADRKVIQKIKQRIAS